MQRIISLEASRSSNFTSEFVTKRLCCSFILSVAFFAVIGGFFLGRFTADRTLDKMRLESSEIYKKLLALDKSLKDTFHDSLHSSNCTMFTTKINCEHFKLNPKESSSQSIKELLDVLNNCFNNG